MPKPLFQDNGSGMHVHQSLWKGGEPLFFDEKGYAGLSDLARWYIGGLLAHAPSLLAFTNPTTNSYKRLVPGYEAPVNLVYSQRNRSAAVRIPLYSKSPKAKRLEFRCPDPSCNPYLAFSAMLMAGLDGIQNRIEPPTPVDRDLYDLPPEELAKVPQVPGSLDEALDALEADHEFLLAGGVFTPDVIDTWIEYKRDQRDRRDPAAPAPVGVLPLLRHLIPLTPKLRQQIGCGLHPVAHRRVTGSRRELLDARPCSESSMSVASRRALVSSFFALIDPPGGRFPVRRRL